MKFKNYLTEKWKKIPIRRTTGRRDVWTYDKYEISKQEDGTFKLVDITQTIRNEYKELGIFSSLKKAKDSIGD